jgi:multimeric flavodoxin WrbA
MTQEKKKKIIGLSTGRKDGNSEVLLKVALMAAEKHGVETEIIRAMDHEIKPCIGCEGCVLSLNKTGVSKCAIKGDAAEWLLTKVLVEGDALIMSMPIYHLVPNSHYFVISHRQHPIMFNNPQLLKKTRPGAVMCVGGGEIEWTPLGLMSGNIMLQHAYTLVDQVQFTGHGRPAQVLVRQADIDRAARLGDNVARSMFVSPDEMKYLGDPGQTECPVCHCNVVQVADALPNVVCPVCDVHGVIRGQGEEMAVQWDPQEAKASRLTEYGVALHLEEIKNKQKTYFAEYHEKVQELVKPYKEWGNYPKPDMG